MAVLLARSYIRSMSFFCISSLYSEGFILSKDLTCLYAMFASYFYLITSLFLYFAEIWFNLRADSKSPFINLFIIDWPGTRTLKFSCKGTGKMHLMHRSSSGSAVKKVILKSCASNEGGLLRLTVASDSPGGYTVNTKGFNRFIWAHDCLGIYSTPKDPKNLSSEPLFSSSGLNDPVYLIVMVRGPLYLNVETLQLYGTFSTSW